MIDFLLYIIGWLILRVTYPNKEKRNVILKNKYDNDLLAVTMEYPLKIVAVICIMALIFFLLATLYKVLSPISL